MALAFYTYAEGTIVVVGKSPDGDSVRFRPDEPNAFDEIHRAHKLRPSRDGTHQLRIEGIDAPETHYANHAQPFGDEARDHFLKSVLGFQSLAFKKEVVTSAQPETLQAAVLTKAADPFGRPIAYLLIGDAVGNPFGNAKTGHVSEKVVEATTNYRMVADGFAYSLLYTSMPKSHRAHFTAAAKAARTANKGVWRLDHSDRFPLLDRGSVEPGAGHAAVLIYPKLFRRAIDYFKSVDKGFDGNFVDWLVENVAENDSVVVNRHDVSLSELITQENDRYRFEADLTEVVFVEK